MTYGPGETRRKTILVLKFAETEPQLLWTLSYLCALTLEAKLAQLYINQINGHE